MDNGIWRLLRQDMVWILGWTVGLAAGGFCWAVLMEVAMSGKKPFVETVGVGLGISLPVFAVTGLVAGVT